MPLPMLCPFKLATKGTANVLLGPAGKPAESYNPGCVGTQCMIFIEMRDNKTGKVVESGCSLALTLTRIHTLVAMQEMMMMAAAKEDEKEAAPAAVPPTT